MPKQQVMNRSRLINFLTGINGVTANGQANVNLAVNQRYHRNVLQCTAVNYTGGIALTTTKITGAGNDDLTVTPTVVNGVITSVAVVAGGTGYVTGDTITINDATGAGFVGTVTAAAGVVTAVAVTSVGSPTAASPTLVLGSVIQRVNGVVMRDISPANILRLAFANGLFPKRGELPLLYTTPWRDHVTRNDSTSWDVFGQSAFQLQFGVRGVTTPGLVGVSEFDEFRNSRMQDGKEVLFLEPTAQHEFTWPLAAGRNDITNIPKNFPISRIWLKGSNPGNVSQLEIYQDGNKRLEATTEQLKQMYQEYGFQFGEANYINANWATDNALKSQYEQPSYFDAAYISDPDSRWSKRLIVANELIVRVYSEVAQDMTFVVEQMPGGYIG